MRERQTFSSAVWALELRAPYLAAPDRISLSHSSRSPTKPSSEAVLKLMRAAISRRLPLFVSFTFR